jgi:D-lactate dehydrogenase
MTMTNIHFFDAGSDTAGIIRRVLDTLLSKPTIEFHPGPAIPVPDATIISPFVTSQITADIIAAMPSLKLIACRSTGYDNVDIQAAKKRGISVCNVPSYGENTVAEYAFGLILALARKIPQAIEQLKAGNTSHTDLQGIDLMGKTLGILGAGRIGCHMAQIGRGFGMNVVAFDKFTNPKLAEQYGFIYLPQDEVLAQADILSLHVPNIPETKHLINSQTLALMKSTSVIINTARGEIVDARALIEALSEHRLAGAALDVFEGENVASLDDELDQLRASEVDRLILQRSLEISVLQKLPNVILTNHNAFNTTEAVQRINQTTVENIAAFLAGKPQNEVKS